MDITSIPGDDSFLAGAIFMSNRATKKECFSRKLFGLPSFQASFVKKLKMGMILFLFEYEERKLYGVFEATSDGAMNIAPTAFTSSGRHFPAQVSFRIIWRCPPLTEGEFYDAIRDNYYEPDKFHFHLSEKQVCKLLELFNSQKLNSKDYKLGGGSRYTHKNGGKKCQNSMSVKLKPNKQGSTNLGTYSHLPGTNLDHLAYHDESLQIVDKANGGMEAALLPLLSPLEEQQSELPGYVKPSSQCLSAIREHVSANPEDDYLYQQFPGICMKESLIGTSTINSSCDRIAYCVDSFDVHPSSRYENYPFYNDANMVNVGSSIEDEYNYNFPALASKGTAGRSNINNLQASICRGSQTIRSINKPQNGHSSSPRFDCHYASDIFSPCLKNHLKHHLDVAKSLQNSSDIGLHAYGCCVMTPQCDKNSRGSGYQFEHQEIMPSLECETNSLDKIESSLCSSPVKALLPVAYSSGSSKYQDKGLGLSTIATSSKSRSESQKRSSVFGRLFKSKKTTSRNFEIDQPNMDASLGELVRHLSSKQQRWCKMAEVAEVPILNKKTKRKVPQFKRKKLFPSLTDVKEASDHFVMLDGDEEFGQVHEFPSQLSALPCIEEGADGSNLPFFNFKRRSEAQRKTCGTEPGNSESLRENEVSSVKNKRRKLLRPSFGEEDMSNKVDDVHNGMEETQNLCPKEDKKQLQNMQKLCTVHRHSPFFTDVNNVDGEACDAGGQKTNMPLTHAPPDNNAKTCTINHASVRQFNFQNTEILSKQLREHGVITSHKTGNGIEKSLKSKYLEGCKSSSLYIQVFLDNQTCQTSVGAATKSEIGGLSSNEEKKAGKKNEENICGRLHLAECNCKNIICPQRKLSSKGQEQDDCGITNELQYILFKTTVTTTYDLFCAEGSRETKEKMGTERHQVFPNATGSIETAGLLSSPSTIFTDGSDAGLSGKKSFQVLENEKKATEHVPLSTAEDTPTTRSPPKRCTDQTGEQTSNTAVGTNSKVKCNCGLATSVETQPSNEAAASTSKRQ